MNDAFEVTWEAEDGYCGGARPHHFDISTDDFEKDTTEQELEEIFNDMLDSEFSSHVAPSTSDLPRFLEWAKERQKEME